MQRWLKWAVVGAVASFLAGCGTLDTPAVQAKLTGKSITVVSTVGETVELSWRGTTLFNNEEGLAAVPNWGLRARLEDRAVALLEGTGRFTSVQRAHISATRRDDALKQLKELKTGSTHVLLITPHVSGDSIFGTKTGFSGLGVAQSSLVGINHKSATHASLRADLMEVGMFQTSLAHGTSANAQLVPAPALLSGPRLNPEYAPAARAALQVQVDAVMQSLMTQMGLDQPVALQGKAHAALTGAAMAPASASAGNASLATTQPAEQANHGGAQAAPVRDDRQAVNGVPLPVPVPASVPAPR